jgi:hypothetical protein
LEVEAMQVNKTDVSLLEKDANKYDASVIIKTSGLSKHVKSLMNDFIVMEEYFLRRAIEKVNLIFKLVLLEIFAYIIKGHENR